MTLVTTPVTTPVASVPLPWEHVELPPFHPHPLLRSGHAQTILGVLARGPAVPYRAARRQVVLSDGDRLVLHDDCPAGWSGGDRVALLLHGLGGSYRSSYMVRVTAKLNVRGVRTFRMDLRGCGAGYRLARHPGHAGRSEDAAAALQAVARLCAGSPIGLVGFSMSGNLVLKLAGEAAGSPPQCLAGVLAVAPPLRILRCALHLREATHPFYTRNFLRALVRQVRDRRRYISAVAEIPLTPLPRHILEFDDRFTAPLSGFSSAQEYYDRCSAAELLAHIQIPTLIIAAQNDPLIPVDIFRGLSLSASCRLHITEGGGHLGYVGVRGVDPDRRWLDWRIVQWLMQLGCTPA